MDSTPLTTLLSASALAAALALAPGAAAVETPDQDLQLTGAYAYFNPATGATHVVVSTATPINRRADGSSTGTLTLGGVTQRLRGVKPGARRCLQAAFVVRGGRITEGGANLPAPIGRRFRIVVRAGGESATRVVTHRKQRAGDVTGKPMGC